MCSSCARLARLNRARSTSFAPGKILADGAQSMKGRIPEVIDVTIATNACLPVAGLTQKPSLELEQLLAGGRHCIQD